MIKNINKMRDKCPENIREKLRDEAKPNGNNFILM